MNPQISQRQIYRELNACYGPINQIIKFNHYHPYHINLHQVLSDNDKMARVGFCRWDLEKITEDPLFFYQVMFSDEVTFKSNGSVNRHNCHYYSVENLHWLE